MTLGYFDALATTINKIPKANLTTIADMYSAVFSTLLSIQPIMISGLKSNHILASSMSIPNNLIINFMIDLI